MTDRRGAQFDRVWRARLEADPASLGLDANLRARKALTLLAPGRRLLDVGCGAGTFAKAAAERFTDIYGVDVSDEAVTLARTNGVDARTLDVGSDPLPFEDGAFDTIVTLSTLQYIVDLERALRECRRVLRPGGQFLAGVPNMRAAWRLWTLAVGGRFPRTSLDMVGVDGGAVHYFTSSTIRSLAIAAGFDLVASFGVFCRPRWMESSPDGGPIGWLKREFLSAEVIVDMRAR